MIRSTKVSLKFSNELKRNNIILFLNEYRNVVKNFVDILWNIEKIPVLIPKELSQMINSWLSARMIQCAGKQASGIVRGTRKKQEKTKFIIDKLIKEGKFKESEKLQKLYDSKIISKPEINKIEPELDSRFIKINLNNHTSFDGWLTIGSIGDKLKLILPFKRTKHFNKLYKCGILKLGIRLSRNNITFNFEIPDVLKKENGCIVGIDVGLKNVISCSNGNFSTPNNHNYDLMKITSIICRRKLGSKGFKKAQQHRKNYINWCINQLNFSNVKQVNIENIKYLRRNKKTSKKLKHWNYRGIFDKLKSYCEEQGVLVQMINPTYTSQRCSSCGWTQKANRNGSIFKCKKCLFTHDSDLNAAKNISFQLETINFQQRLNKTNRDGFYWLTSRLEPIVPIVSKI